MILRPVEPDDADILYQQSGHPADLRFPTQRAWIEDRLQRPGFDMFIGVDEECGPVAWGAITHHQEYDELHWVVTPRFRREGFGEQIASLLLARAQHNRVVAKIKLTNLPSRLIAHRIGVEIIDEDV